MAFIKPTCLGRNRMSFVKKGSAQVEVRFLFYFKKKKKAPLRNFYTFPNGALFSVNSTLKIFNFLSIFIII